MASIGPMAALVAMCLCVAALPSVASGSVASFGPYYASSCAPFNADAAAVFDIETVATYEFSMSADAFDSLVNDTTSAKSYKYTKAGLNLTVAGGGESFDAIGIRVRGKGSRGLAKHSFTVKFDKYSDDQRLFNMSKIALRAEPFDPTVSRENLALEFLNAMGVCTQRKAYATVTINGVYMGTYLQVEIINEDWLAARVHSAPLLYKLNLYSTEYQGEEQLFAPVVSLFNTYVNGGKDVIKTGSSSVSDYSPLFYLQKLAYDYDTGVINEDVFAASLGSRFDVSGYLRAAACEVVLASWDCAIADGNNWFMFYDTVRDKSVYVPYDEDIVAGVGLELRGTICPPYDWGCHYSSPFFESLLNVSRFQAQYSSYLATAAEAMATDPAIPAYVAAVKAVIEGFAPKTYYMSGEAPFPPDTFYDGFTETVCGSGDFKVLCDPPLMPWLQAWAANVTAQLRPPGQGPWVTYAEVSNTPLLEHPTEATVTIFVDVADGSAPAVVAAYSYDRATNLTKAFTMERVAANTCKGTVQIPAIDAACAGLNNVGIYAPLVIASTVAGVGAGSTPVVQLYPELPHYLSFFCWSGTLPTSTPSPRVGRAAGSGAFSAEEIAAMMD